MKRYWACFKLVIKHKWYVFWECLKMGVPFHRALLHDISKFYPAEFFAYARNFFDKNGKQKIVRDKSGAYDPNEQALEFRKAWLHHQRNKHHWQAWAVIGDSGQLSFVSIPETYLREMVADWAGAGRAYQGEIDCLKWFNANRNKILMDQKSMEILIALVYTHAILAGGKSDQWFAGV